MAEITLTAETGRAPGTSASRRLRAEGKVPAVLYGRGMDVQAVTVEWRELRAALITDKGLSALITLAVGDESHMVVIRDMQRHPVRRDVTHLDFLAVDVNKPIAAEVPVIIEGEAEKVVRDQGVVEQVQSFLIVHGKPGVIPGHIAVDVTDLEVGDVISIGDLPMPEGVTTEMDPHEPVVTAKLTSLALTEEEEEGEEGEAAAEAGEAEAESGE